MAPPAGAGSKPRRQVPESGIPQGTREAEAWRVRAQGQGPVIAGRQRPG